MLRQVHRHLPLLPPPPLYILAIPVIINNTAILVDENGKLLIPVDSEYQPIIAGDYQNTVWAMKNKTWHLISRDGSKVIKADFPGEALGDLIPNFFWFVNGGKYGIVDAQGNIIQAPSYDEIYAGGDEEFIAYKIGEKFGILNAQGELVTHALYDDVDLGNLARNGGLIIGKRGEESWVINTKTKAQTQVPYSSLSGIENGYIGTTASDGKWGLADLEGKPLIPAEYARVGTPAEGLIPFNQGYGDPCGYLDLQGKVVIEPQFAQCHSFGKKGAFAEEKTPDGSGKYGLIDRTGKWIEPQQKYDYADEGGVSAGGLPHYAPGTASIAARPDLFTVKAGLYDTDKGVEIIAPTYAQVSSLTDTLLRFSAADSPVLNTSPGVPLPTLGIMDRTGKVLLKPGQFTDIALDDSGKFLVAVGEGKRALFDLNGKEVIAQQWSTLKVSTALNAVFAYENWQVTESDTIPVLRAAYSLNGKPVFSIKDTECGAEQLLDSQGIVVWPQDVTPFCPREEE
jgi:hypothetical protein